MTSARLKRLVCAGVSALKVGSRSGRQKGTALTRTTDLKREDTLALDKTLSRCSCDRQTGLEAEDATRRSAETRSVSGLLDGVMRKGGLWGAGTSLVAVLVTGRSSGNEFTVLACQSYHTNPGIRC